MTIQQNLLRFLLTLACVLAIAGGCAGGPGASGTAQPDPADTTSNYEYDGWLFKSLTKKNRPATDTAAAQRPSQTSTPWKPDAEGSGVSSQQPAGQASYPSGVVQASAAVPSTSEAAGRLIPGPSSRSSLAGPPPSIPDELPTAPPEGAISVSMIKSVEEKDKGFTLGDLAPDAVYNKVKAAAGYGPDEKIARAMMAEGKTLFRDKKFKEAREKFATAAARWPDSPLEEDALFLQSESEFFSDQYPKAHDTIGGLLKKYPNTRHLDTVMSRQFAIGRYWEQLYDKNPSWPVTPNVTDDKRPIFDTFGYAVQAYERIRAFDPKGPLADDSLMALGNAYFLRGRWSEAADEYEALLKEYPNSEHQLKAHLYALQANMRNYQGSAYDQTPLTKADRVAKNTLAQYRNELGDEQKRVARAAMLIREEQANRDFVRGDYYEKKRYYGSARMYYDSVVKQFPGTEKAKEAQQRLDAIKDKPDEPTDHLRWLKKMVGEEE